MAELNQTFANNALKYVGKGPTNFRKWYYGEDRKGVPWCAVFVSYVADATGILGKIVKKCEGAGDFARQGVAAKWGTWYEGGSKPQVGDIVSFVNNGLGRYPGQDAYFSDHVGIVYKVDSQYVYTVEGNTGSDSNDLSSVNKRSYSLKSEYINGYYRPNWKKVSTNVVQTIKTGYLREQPWYDDEGGTSRKICTVPKGVEVDYIEDDEWGWGKITYQKKTGWIQNSYLNKKGISDWRYATFTRNVTCEKVKDAKTKKEFKKDSKAYIISLLDTGKYKGKAIINSGGTDYYVSQSYIKYGAKRTK